MQNPTLTPVYSYPVLLSAEVGSRLFGTNVETSDFDYMGICVPPPTHVIGLSQFEQEQSQSQPEGTRAGPTDKQETYYDLRKFCRLALKGNPTILTLLYVPESMCEVRTDHGAMLQSLHTSFHSRHMVNAFVGYMRSQRLRLENGTVDKRINRPDLVEKYGFDTKYAYHMLRLGLQGIEILRKGKLTLPMHMYDIEMLVGVRNGEYSREYCLAVARDLEREVENMKDKVPNEPDYDTVNKYLIDTYQKVWGEHYA
jgi:predicted nucleotidyltransferase